MATADSKPVGHENAAVFNCVQCQSPIRTSYQTTYWLGCSEGDTSQFWGYFCSTVCRDVFANRPDDDKLRAVMGSEEAVRKLVGGTNAGYYRPDGEGEDA